MNDAEQEERDQIARVLDALIAVAAVAMEREQREVERQARLRLKANPRRVNADWMRKAS